jgi:hypothetical protein
MAKCTIKSVICTRLGVAGQFAVVQLDNDLYAITIDGQVLEVFTWHAGQLSECVQFMMHLASRPMPPTPPKEPRRVPLAPGPSAAA